MLSLSTPFRRIQETFMATTTSPPVAEDTTVVAPSQDRPRSTTHHPKEAPATTRLAPAAGDGARGIRRMAVHIEIRSAGDHRTDPDQAGGGRVDRFDEQHGVGPRHDRGRADLTRTFGVERATGIEPAFSAWEADVNTPPISFLT